MMISPNCFIDKIRHKAYKELLKEREKLLESIYSFEKNEERTGNIIVSPSPEVRYQTTLEYLGELCKLISQKYNEEYIWKRK